MAEKRNDLLITEQLASNLECPVCMDFFTPPIYQCVNGHSLCAYCSDRNTTCPECRSSLSNKVKNIALERMLENIEKNCRYPG